MGRLRIRRRSAALAAALTAVMAALAAPASAAPRLELAIAMTGGQIDLTATPPATAFGAVAPTVVTVRSSLHWRKVQPNCRAIDTHRYDWSQPDALMRLFAQRDVAPMLTVAQPPACASLRHDSRLQPKRRYKGDFAVFVRKAFARYGPGGRFFDLHPTLDAACCALRRIEIWNEENLPKQWVNPRPAAYGRFFVRVAKELRSADNWSRRIELISGGVAGLNGGNWPSNGRDYIKGLYRVRGFKRAADAIGIHTYAPTARRTVHNVGVIRRIMSRHHDGARLEITEHGWSTCPKPGDDKGKCVTRRRQARLLRSVVKGIREENGRLEVRTFMWFMAQDTATRSSVANCRRSPKYFYGFFDHAGDRKRSAHVWEQLTGLALPTSIPEASQLKRC